MSLLDLFGICFDHLKAIPLVCRKIYFGIDKFEKNEFTPSSLEKLLISCSIEFKVRSF